MLVVHSAFVCCTCSTDSLLYFVVTDHRPEIICIPSFLRLHLLHDTLLVSYKEGELCHTATHSRSSSLKFDATDYLFPGLPRSITYHAVRFTAGSRKKTTIHPMKNPIRPTKSKPWNTGLRNLKISFLSSKQFPVPSMRL